MEWGPWIDHDGKAQPVLDAVLVDVVERDGERDAAPAGEFDWVWSKCCAECWAGDIIRYRIRKPRALIELQDMIADLPVPTERVDA